MRAEGDDHDVYVDDDVYDDHDEDLISFEEAHNKCGWWKGQIISNICEKAFKPELRKPTRAKNAYFNIDQKWLGRH